MNATLEDCEDATKSASYHGKVYFYGGCLVDVFDAPAGLAAMQILRHCGVEVIFPQAQSCCGQPAYNSGASQQAHDVAYNQLGLFKEPIPIIVPSGSCAGMMRIHWPRLLADRVDDVRMRTRRVYEWSDFLLNHTACDFEDHGDPITVTCHSSCAMQRELGQVETLSKLLARLKNVTTIAPSRSDECCGFGGTFAVKFPEISVAMGNDKIDALTASKADIIVSGDPGCMMHLATLAERRSNPVPIVHIAQFIADRLGLSDDHPMTTIPYRRRSSLP